MHEQANHIKRLALQQEVQILPPSLSCTSKPCGFLYKQQTSLMGYKSYSASAALPLISRQGIDRITMTTLQTCHIFLKISISKYFVFWQSCEVKKEDKKKVLSQKTDFDFDSRGFCVQDWTTKSKLLTVHIVQVLALWQIFTHS